MKILIFALVLISVLSLTRAQSIFDFFNFLPYANGGQNNIGQSFGNPNNRYQPQYRNDYQRQPQNSYFQNPNDIRVTNFGGNTDINTISIKGSNLHNANIRQK